MPAREKGVPFDFDSPFQGLLQVTRKERSGWGRVSREGGGLGLRGTEGRPGIISRPSVQTHMCSVSPTLFTQAVPTARSAPGSPPWPVPTPYPQEAPPQESPLSVSHPFLITPTCLLPHPRPQNSQACHVRTVSASTLGHMPGRRKLIQEAGELASLMALLFAWPQPQVGWEAAAVFRGTAA